MKVLIEDKNGRREVAVTVQPEIVMQGGHWHAGVEVQEEGFSAECVGYAMNEGSRLFDTWSPDVHGEEVDPLRFTVSHATSAELSEIHLLNGELPPGAVVKTEDGYTFTVVEGRLTDGDLFFANLAEINVGFVLTNTDLPPFPVATN